MSSFGRFVRTLARIFEVRNLVATYLCACRTHKTSKLYYEQLTSAFLIGDQSNLVVRSQMTDQQVSRSSRRSKVRRLRTQATSHNNDWTRFPEKHKLFCSYEAFTNIYMCYILVRNTLTWLFPKLSFLERPTSCYLVGQLSLTRSVAKLTGTTFAIYHLAWRFVQAYLIRPRLYPFAMFMLQDPDELRRFARRYDGSLAAELEEIPAATNRSTLSSRELFLRHLMCYPVTFRTRLIYCLRPNRGFDAYKLMSKSALNSFKVTLYLVLIPAIAITSVCVKNILLDVNYVKNYPQCDSHLEHLRATKQLSDWSITITWHRFCAAVFDALDNLVLWLDSGTAISVCVSWVHIINKELSVYWDSIEGDIRALKRKMELEWDASSSDDATASRPPIPPGNSNRLPKATYDSGSRSPVRMFDARQQTRLIQLEVRVNCLQTKLIDFFRQFDEADYMVSDILSMAILAWCLTTTIWINSMIAYDTSEPTQYDALLVHLYPVIIFLTISLLILELQRSILSAYAPMCTIMALDRSRCKERFLELLGYYTHRRRFAYTLFRQYPYTKTTLITLTGWTLTGAVILQSLHRNRAETV